MAQLPDYVTITLSGYGEEIEPGLIVSKMDRGVAKTRLGNTRVMSAITATLLFKSRQDSIAFVTWWNTTIKRAGWFDVKDPHTGVVRSMRFVNGSIGTLSPVTSAFALAQRNVTLEYLF